MALRQKICKRQDGQATVEFAVVFPSLIIVAVIAINALLFCSECASFDRCARQTIRAVATSPGYGQSNAMCAARIQTLLEEGFDQDYLSSSVEVEGGADGLLTYTATLTFHPTLFGMGLKDQVFGVSLPSFEHRACLSVESYRPGMLQ